MTGKDTAQKHSKVPFGTLDRPFAAQAGDLVFREA